MGKRTCFIKDEEKAREEEKKKYILHALNVLYWNRKKANPSGYFCPHSLQ